MARHILRKLSAAAAVSAFGFTTLALGAGPAQAQPVGTPAGTARYILEMQGYTCSRFIGTDTWVCTKPGAPTYDCVGYECQPVVSTIVAQPYRPTANQVAVATAR